MVPGANLLTAVEADPIAFAEQSLVATQTASAVRPTHSLHYFEFARVSNFPTFSSDAARSDPWNGGLAVLHLSLPTFIESSRVRTMYRRSYRSSGRLIPILTLRALSGTRPRPDAEATGVLGLEIADLDHLQLAVLLTHHALHPEADRVDAGAGGGRARGSGHR